MLQRERNSLICVPSVKKRRLNGFKLGSRNLDGWVGADATGELWIRTVSPPVSPQNESGSRFMPRYFFNTRIGEELIADPEGEVLRDPDSAWEIARAMIRELLKTEGVEAGLLNATLEVTDDDGEIVLEFPFTEAILDISSQSATRH
jgi:hypothetical protein